MHQVYVPKKVEVVVKPVPVTIPPPSIMIGSMTVPIEDITKPIVIGGQDPVGDKRQVGEGVTEV